MGGVDLPPNPTMGLRTAVTDQDLVRSTPPPGDPAQLPERYPLPGPPAIKPSPSPPRSRVLIDLRPDRAPEPEPLRCPLEAITTPAEHAGDGGTEIIEQAGGFPDAPSRPAVLSLATAAAPERSELPNDDQLQASRGDALDGEVDTARSTTTWPEVRFYLGAFSLFFVSYVLVTALLVAGATVVLGLRPVAVTSGSMEPVIRAGDVVMFAGPPAGLLGPGTVVGFDEPGTNRPVTHRVVRANPDGTYVTQGDANHEPDPQHLDRDRVWGVGRLLIPYAGYPATWLAVGAGWKVASLVVFLLGCGFSCRWAVLDEYNPWLAQ